MAQKTCCGKEHIICNTPPPAAFVCHRAATDCVQAASCNGSSTSCLDPVPLPGLCCDGVGGFLPSGSLCRWVGRLICLKQAPVVGYAVQGLGPRRCAGFWIWCSDCSVSPCVLLLCVWACWCVLVPWHLTRADAAAALCALLLGALPFTLVCLLPLRYVAQLLYCRAAASICDVPEYCTASGTNTTSCPPDQYAAAGTTCRWGPEVQW